MGTGIALCGEVARASSVYQPRRPEQGALHQVVRDHFETFRAEAAAIGATDKVCRVLSSASSAIS